jgi:hypothetical protein
MSREELLALPAAVDLGTANRAMGISRSTGYELARRGQYPCPVLAIGRSYRVPTAGLLEALRVEPAAAVEEPVPASMPAVGPVTQEERPATVSEQWPFVACCDCCPCTCRRNARHRDEEGST